MTNIINSSKQNNAKRLISGMNVGSSSILVTFVLLCLVTFAALSFVSANSDYKLSLQAAKRTQSYYEANMLAETKLSNIHSVLSDIYKNTSTENEYFEAVILSFCNDEFVSCISEDNSSFLKYEIPVSDNQRLSVILTLNYPETDNSIYYTIKSWQSISSYSDEDLYEDTKPRLIF